MRTVFRSLATWVLALLVACSGTATTSVGTSANRTPAPDQQLASATATAAPVDQPTPTPTPEPEPDEPPPIIDEVGTLDEPLPIEDTPFSFVAPFSDDQWNGTVIGLVQVERDDTYSSYGQGFCIAILGTISQTVLSAGVIGRTSRGPEFGVVTEGRLTKGSYNLPCDNDRLEELGYVDIEVGQATRDTELAFYSSIFIEGETTDIEVVLAGDLNDNDLRYFEPTDIGQAPRAAYAPGTYSDPIEPMVEATFSYDHSSGGSTWDVELLGIVEVDSAAYSDRPGDCYAVLGSVAPTEIEDGAISNGARTPPVALVADGRLFDSSDGIGCDMSLVERQGFKELRNANVTLNTIYPFGIAVRIPEGLEPQAVLLGRPTENEVRAFRPAIVNGVPSVQSGGGSSIASDRDLQQLRGAEFTTTNRGDEWNGTLFGLVEVPQADDPDEEGRCMVLLGTLTPADIDTGSVTSGYDAPSHTLIASGQEFDGSFVSSLDCDLSDVVDAGYDRLSSANLTEGTGFAFYQAFLVPEGAELEAVTLGSANDSNAVFYEADLIDEVLEPGSSAVGSLNRELEPLEGTSFSAEDYSDTQWDVVVFGLTEGTHEFNDADLKCYLLFGSVTPTDIGEGGITNGFSTADFSAVANGVLFSDQWFSCENDALEEAGYGNLGAADVTEGTEYLFATAFVMPQGFELEAIVFGDPTDEGATYWLPTLSEP